jgi:hypothetical protein
MASVVRRVEANVEDNSSCRAVDRREWNRERRREGDFGESRSKSSGL